MQIIIFAVPGQRRGCEERSRQWACQGKYGKSSMGLQQQSIGTHRQVRYDNDNQCGARVILNIVCFC